MAYNHKRPPEFLDERIRKRRLEVTGSSRRSELGNRSGGSGHSSSGPLGFPPPPPLASRLPHPGPHGSHAPEPARAEDTHSPRCTLGRAAWTTVNEHMAQAPTELAALVARAK